MPTPRSLTPLLVASALACAAPTDGPGDSSATGRRPNVVIVMTDDQGYGDFGFAGNPAIETPHLDALFAQSARLEPFYVSPVCAPTRAALMTGRWCQRTRAIDTYIGRAMMDPAEVTLAELLRDAGWATGIFGKWHLGDCYPMRAMDQGFEQSLVHRGGGIGQPSDPEGGESRYTDAVLFRDGQRVQTRGYCTDVYFDAAIEFMRGARAEGRPFFAYVPTNAPHGPFGDVPEALLEHYRSKDLAPTAFPSGSGRPLPAEWNQERLARIFAMITNIDENVGRLLAALDAMGAREDTLVLFLVDNGPNTRRYGAGLRGMKGEVYEGGVRSPLLARWPARLAPGLVRGTNGEPAAHVDLLPTVLEACGIDPPGGRVLDGRSVLTALAGGPLAPRERPLVIQAHRGDRPVRYQHFMLRRGRWKLVNPSGFGPEVESVEPRFELYDLEADPFERHDRASERPELVQELAAEYQRWFEDVTADAWPYDPPPIQIGAAEAPEVHLTRQDWRRDSSDGGWGGRSRGHWVVRVVAEGPYRVRVRFPRAGVERVSLRVGDTEHVGEVDAQANEHVFESVALPQGLGRLTAELEDGEGVVGALQVVVSAR